MSSIAPAPFPDVDAVAIGASAGGVDALLTLLPRLPADFAAAVLVVLHLPPDRPSGLAELLGQRCTLPVAEAQDKQPVVPGRIVIAPPDYHLLVEPNETVALSMDEPVRFSRPAIDLLFESAAIAYGPRLLALVLSGGSDDGAEGLRSVRQHGGIAWVQDPASAVAPAMPAAALQRAGADAVLTVPQMAQRFAAASPRPGFRPSMEPRP
jgi:two-component system chemotaxis response regulator CheB